MKKKFLAATLALSMAIATMGTQCQYMRQMRQRAVH